MELLYEIEYLRKVLPWARDNILQLHGIQKKGSKLKSHWYRKEVSLTFKGPQIFRIGFGEGMGQEPNTKPHLLIR